MHNLDDNELDRLSREAADLFEPDMATPGWDGLQRRLDREMPIRKDDRDRRYWLLLLLLLLVGGGSAYYFQRNGTGTTLPVANKEAEKAAGKDRAVTASNASKSATEAAVSSSANPTSNETAESTKSGVAESSARSNTASLQKAKQSTEIIQGTGEQHESVNKTKAARQKSGGRFNSDGGSLAAGYSATNGTDDLQQMQLSKSSNRSQNPAFHIYDVEGGSRSFDFAGLQNRTPKMNVATAPNTATPAASIAKKEKKASDFALRPFEFGIIVGPDKSQVHGTKDGQSGFNLGLSFAYNINKRWQINAGLIYNKKYYSAKGEDYHAPKGYWTDTVTLSMVNASCLMWDLPINVRYNIVANKNYSIFASAGISSYFMRTEDYGYHYYYYTGQYGYRYKSTPTHDAYWMSVGNLSAGYEQNLGSFSVQAEPYVKFALRGVGMGKVDLNSYGMNIGLKYKPSWSLKKTHPRKN